MTSEEPQEIIGFIYPLFQEHIQRFFNQGKTVFVKFAAGTPTRLSPGSRLFFYQSRNKREVVGEARIVEISSATADEVLARYTGQLFLTPTELREYVANRNAKRMLVLVLDKFRNYDVPLRLDKAVTMAGQYMTKIMYEQSVRP